VNNHYSQQSSDSSSDDEVVSECVDVDWRKRFLETIFGPALGKLSGNTPSRVKGAGNFHTKKWYIHHSDWSKICYHADKISTENNVFGQCL